MVLIDDLGDSANSGDQVSHLWVNAVSTTLTTHTTQIGGLQTSIGAINQKLGELIVTAGAGLTASFTGGVFLNSSGSYVTIAPGSIVVPANATTKIYVSEAGVISQGATVPPRALELATVVSNATDITSVSTAPRLKAGVEPVKIVEAYLNNQTDWQSGVKGGIAGWSAPVNQGGVLNVNSGLITLPAAARYRVEVSLALLAQSTATNVRVGLSLYGGTNELKILDTIHTANVVGGEYMILNGFYETRTGNSLGAGVVCRFELGVDYSSSSPLRLKPDENNAFTLWRL